MVGQFLSGSSVGGACLCQAAGPVWWWFVNMETMLIFTYVSMVCYIFHYLGEFERETLNTFEETFRDWLDYLMHLDYSA